jgi:hypothetical protein
LVEVVEDPPAVESAILSALEDYLPSLTYVKCWMYAIYRKTYRTVFWRLRRVNGEWVELEPRIETEVETVQVRLHIGGVPCRDWRAFPPPKRLNDLSNNPSWGWIESRSFDPPR